MQALLALIALSQKQHTWLAVVWSHGHKNNHLATDAVLTFSQPSDQRGLTMCIGIIGPMDEEVSLLLSVIQNQQETVVGGRKYISGTYAGRDVVLVKSGIGKICAAEAALVLVLQFKVDAVINTGCAGGIGDGMKIGDIVLSSKLAYHDFNLTIFGYKRGQVPDYEQYFEADAHLLEVAQKVAQDLKAKGDFTPEVRVGVVLSGDQFISEKAVCLDMKKDFPEAQVTEMEGAAVAQVCTDFKVPFLIIRSASDNAEGEAPAVFEEFVQLAADNSAKLVEGLIAAL